MNNAQHTPGPWRLELEDGGMGVFPTVGSDTFSDVDAIAYVEMIPDRDCCLVDDVARLRRDQEEAQANARLIAASPTLYEFVRKLADEGSKDANELLASLNLSD